MLSIIGEVFGRYTKGIFVRKFNGIYFFGFENLASL